ncbi:MAG: hypothetical protein OXG62_11975 [Nitrospinae bacterium]|nr:hypothetical protein [Nitrospinota bacterium]
MSSGSACFSEESFLQDFCGRIGLKMKLMSTADGRAPPGTRTPEGRSRFSFR